MYSETPDIFDDFTGQSATAAICDQLALSGATPPKDEQDLRPTPTQKHAETVVEEMFQSLTDLFEDTCFDDQLHDLMWNLTHAYHRKLQRLEDGLQQLSFEMRRTIREQDGSEIKSNELEKLQLRCDMTSEATTFFETMRDQAVQAYSHHTGRQWMPTRGSVTSRSAETASVIAATDFLKANERKKILAEAPDGSKILIAGGTDYEDHKKIYETLDRVHRKYSDMVLIHGGARRGCDHIAATWARNKNVNQIVFSPNWKAHGKNRAGFVRNDAMIATKPIGALIFPGSGLTQNLADKAKAAGIRVKVYR